MAMKICITNDDGIHSEGLQRLVNWAKKHGEVHVYAPKVEQSAKSHAIEIHKAFEAKPAEVSGAARAWAVDSTPADCVRFAILGLHEKFDLVISGVNKGLNIGQDIMYSGTVSAVFEAAALGVRGLALSTDPESFDTAMAQLDNVWSFLQENRLFEKCPIWNVNIPVNTTGEFRITRQGGPYYSDDFAPQPDHMYLPVGKPVWVNTYDDRIDTNAVLQYRHISVSPLTIDRTDSKIFDALR